MKHLAIALWFVLVIQACVDDESTEPPKCGDVGCLDTHALLCKATELCVCPQPNNAKPIDCRP